MELRQYFNVLLKWWWLIIASMVVASVASLLASLSTPRTYQSRTTLMVGQAIQNQNPNQAEFYIGEALAQGYTDLVRREPVLRDTLTALGSDWDWQVLQNMVSSRVVPGTTMMEIGVIDTDPQRAKVLLDEITHQLIQRSPSGNDPERAAERQFIQTQIDDLKVNIQRAQDEIRQLSDVIAQANSAREIQDARTQQAALQTQVTEWQATYTQMLTNLNIGTTNYLSVVEPAQVPTTPLGSSAATNALFAAVIGLVLASGAAYAIEYLDDTVKTPEDVRRVADLTTLGAIASIDGEDYPDKLISATQPRSPITEAYRVLRLNIQFSMVDNPLRTLMITSPNPKEGKSITAANLAVVMAQSGKRVILVDADLRRPTQHHIFSVPNKLGLTSILMDPNVHLQEALQNAGSDSLKVMTSGPIPPNPSEMLGSKRMGYLIEALQQEADVVIFDTAPVLAVTDGLVLSSRLDGTLVVLNAGRTRIAEAKRSKEALGKVGAHLLGVALNRSSKGGSLDYQYYYADSTEDQSTSVPLKALAAIRRLPENVRAQAKRPDRSSPPAPAEVVSGKRTRRSRSEG